MLTLSLLAPLALAKSTPIPEIVAAKELTWVGLDFSVVKIYTAETFDNPNQSYQIAGGGYGYFYTAPDMRTYPTVADAYKDFAEMWNTYYTADAIENLQDAVKRTVKPAAAKAGPTDLSTGDHFLGPNGTAKETDLTSASVTAMVAKWPTGAGLGIGMVADRFSKVDELGCYWPVIYDTASHNVLWTEHMCGEPKGFGYRNYWLGSAKAVTDMLEDVRKAHW